MSIFHSFGLNINSSVQLDSWTIDQLRVMKVGGNQNAKEFLKDSVSNLDAKSRYQSRQMMQYKQKLQQLVQLDVQKNPDELVLEHVEQEVVQDTKKDDDFFSEWNEPSEIKVQKSPIVTRMAFKAPFTSTSAVAPAAIVQEIVDKPIEVESLKSERPTFDINSERTSMPMEQSKVVANVGGKKKFGSRKITKGIDFDEVDDLDP